VGQATARRRGFFALPQGPNSVSGTQPSPGLKRATSPRSPTASASLESAPIGTPGWGAIAVSACRNGVGHGASRLPCGASVKWIGSEATPSQPSVGVVNAAPSGPPGVLPTVAPSAGTRLNDSPSRRRLTPSESPVITRSPYGSDGFVQAILREG